MPNAQCSCPPGWKNDYVGYAHSDNCTLPDTFLLYFFIVYSVLTLVALVVSYGLARKAEKSLRMFRDFFLSWLFLDWSAVLAVFLEDGFYEGSAVVTVVFTWLGTIGPAYIMFKMLNPY
jgi:hypothetical protein